MRCANCFTGSRRRLEFRVHFSRSKLLMTGMCNLAFFGLGSVLSMAGQKIAFSRLLCVARFGKHCGRLESLDIFWRLLGFCEAKAKM